MNSEKFIQYGLIFMFAICATNIMSQSVSRCFSFTWLGPRWNNESTFLNATCQDATRLADGVPCQQPLVVSYDGSRPDVDYIWANHFDNASCILADSDVCAQYTYYFNDHVENSTYMCTRVIDSLGSSITNGCFLHVNGSFSTRVCFCRSIPGGMPCNNAISSMTLSYTIFIVYTCIFMFSYIFK